MTRHTAATPGIPPAGTQDRGAGRTAAFLPRTPLGVQAQRADLSRSEVTHPSRGVPQAADLAAALDAHTSEDSTTPRPLLGQEQPGRHQTTGAYPWPTPRHERTGRDRGCTC